VRIVLLSTYELGQQPISLAWPHAALAAAGFEVHTADLSVEDLPADDVRAADLVAISAPMHTALRLGVEVARKVRRLGPRAHICFYGLYADLNANFLFSEGLADSVAAGEVEPVLLRLAESLARKAKNQVIPGLSTPERRSVPALSRWQYPVPLREGLPGPAAYARLDHRGVQHLAGYSEATRGCLHTCRHCPVVPVYGGRFFAVPLETVLADIRQQVEAGVRHISFGDPDFLNGPTHARRIARRLHAEHPGLTFSFTAKVEHLIKHRELLHELVSLGALFAVSAFESTSDAVLQVLNKGHTRRDMELALAICAEAGLELQPTWVPFTPWTSLSDYVEMLDWIRAHRLVAHVPAVQYSVRLLVPPGSALLDEHANGSRSFFTSLDAENFTFAWTHPDPRMDALQAQVAAAVESGCGCSPYEIFERVNGLARRSAGLPPHPRPAAPAPAVSPPRLTEDWFC
jgi:radical SAM superfamily enzyme YgiQ (UPF0313 family)